MATPFDSIEDAIKDIKKGKFIILVDDEDRENEGDLVMAAGKVTPQAVNFMAKHARGLICLALTPERVEELQLAPQAVADRWSSGRSGEDGRAAGRCAAGCAAVLARSPGGADGEHSRGGSGSGKVSGGTGKGVGLKSDPEVRLP